MDDLDDKQLLANGSSHSLFCGLDCAHGQNVHVNRKAQSDQEVPVNDRESLFSRPASQAHANPPVPNPLRSTADLLPERREIRLNQQSERTFETFVQERVRWQMGSGRSSRFEGRDDLSEPTLCE